MNFYIMTLFPDMVMQGLNTSIIGRAAEKGLLTIEAVNIRDYTINKHKKVDDYPYGGGAGMLMQAEPVYLAYEAVKEQIDTCPESRQDLKDEYQARYDVIAKYAPKLMDASEIKAYLTEKHADLIASGNKGQIMKTIMPELKGKADGKVINQVVAELCK